MRKYLPYTVAAALCIGFFVRLRVPEHPAIPVHGESVYDSTLALLKYFVIKDNRLGFANEAETDSAWIDTADSSAVSVCYPFEDSLFLATGDSVPVNNGSSASIFASMHRVILPVYTRVNGARKLCSSITFDSLPYLHPIMIDDSSLILPAPKFRERYPGEDHFLRTYSPYLHTSIMIGHSPSGYVVVDTKSLRLSLGPSLPKTNNASDEAPIELKPFLNTVRQGMRRRMGLD